MLGFVKKQEQPSDAQQPSSSVKLLGEIHTMPGFGEMPVRPSANRISKAPWLWIAVGAVIIIVAGAAIYFFVFSNQSEKLPPVSIVPIVENRKEPIIEPKPEVVLTPQERDRQRFLDINLIKTALELYQADHSSSYPIKVNEVSLGANGASTLSAAGFSDYPQAPLYLAKVPLDPSTDKGNAYAYSSSAGINYKLTFTLEQGVSNLSSGTHFLTADGFDGKMDKPVDESKLPGDQEQSAIVPAMSLDSDGDLLTDVEEIIYQSAIDNSDSDNDGYVDGIEVKLGYNPVISEGAKLEGSNLVQRYTNSLFSYSILYPTIWQPQSSDELSSEVIFTGETGEFVQVVVQDNPEQKTAVDWYLSYVPSLTMEEIPVIKIGDLTAVRSLDSLSIYLAVQDKLITINYNNGTHNTADYLSTFQMMYQSFKFSSKVSE
ncbi:MAG: hypothetical protein V1712_02350 [Patescibacteria group bacterium]